MDKYKKRAFNIYVEASSSTNSQYTVSVSQDNWVYAPNGGYKSYLNYTKNIYSTFTKEYFLPDNILYDILKSYRVNELGDNEDNIPETIEEYLYGRSEEQLFNICQEDGKRILNSLEIGYNLSDEAFNNISDIGNTVSIIGFLIMPIPVVSKAGNIITIIGAGTAVNSILRESEKDAFSKTLAEGRYNIIFGEYISSSPNVISPHNYFNSWSSKHFINKYKDGIKFKVSTFDNCIKNENEKWELVYAEEK